MVKDYQNDSKIWEKCLSLIDDLEDIKINDFAEIKGMIASKPIINVDELDNRFFKQTTNKIRNAINDSNLVELFILDLFLPLEDQKFTSIYLASNSNSLKKHNERLKILYNIENKLETKIFDSNKVLYYLTKENRTIEYPKPLLYLVNNDNYSSQDFSDVLLIDMKKLSESISGFDGPSNAASDSFVTVIENLYTSLSNSNEDYSSCFDDNLANVLVHNKKITIYGIEFEDVRSAFITYLSFFKAMVPLNHMNKEIAEYIYFPAVSSYHARNRDQLSISNNWIGGVLLAFQNHSTRDLRRSLWQVIQYVVSLTYQNYQLIRLDIEREIAVLATIRAAIAQVFARNLSHNIGSHVLSKLIEWFQVNSVFRDSNWQLKNENQIIDGKEKLFNNIQAVIDKLEPACSFKDCCEHIDNCIETVKELLNISEKKVFNNYSLLAMFFNYLKVRMDYLSDVTMYTPVIENIKCIYNDIVKPFIQNRVLNDRISGIDSFKYEIILCKPIHENGVQLNAKDKQCKDTHTADCKECKIEGNSEIQLSIPNDILGSHAIFTILENIIRNTAKHSNTPKDRNVEFKIKIEEASVHNVNIKTVITVNEFSGSNNIDWNEFYAISIFDNCEKSSTINVRTENCTDDNTGKLEKYKEKQNGEAEEDVKNYITIKELDKLVIDQNHLLNKSILENNQLRHGGWGLIEMDASAAYLRKIDIELIDSDKYKITDLYGKNPVTEQGELAILQAYAEQEKYLGYRFFIRKPQEILIVCNDNDLHILEDGIKSDLRNKGVWIFDKNTFMDFFTDNKQKVFPHKLVVVLNDEDEEIIDKIKENKSCFSKRVYQLNERELKNGNIDEFKLYLWNRYYEKDKIKLYDDNVKGVYSAHGSNYCKLIKQKHQFIEIWNSSTDHFFKTDDLTYRNTKVPTYKFSWPIRIAVLDERIQSFSKESYAISQPEEERCFDCDYHENGVRYSEIYRRTNIFVPSYSEANLNSQNFNEEYDKIIEYIKNLIQEHERNDEGFGNALDCNPFEFIVVHLGIMEKLISSYNNAKETNFDKEKPDDVSRFIKEILLDKKNEMYDSIVITSGRGKPHNLPNDIRYLNFSVVSQYLITLRNKFAFTEAVYCARKQNQ